MTIIHTLHEAALKTATSEEIKDLINQATDQLGCVHIYCCPRCISTIAAVIRPNGLLIRSLSEDTELGKDAPQIRYEPA